MKHLIKIIDAGEIEYFPYNFIVALDDNDNVFIKLPIPNNEIHYMATSRLEPHNLNAFDGAEYLNGESEFNNGKGILKFDRDVTSIGNSAFAESYKLTAIIIPNSVTSIGYEAFLQCSSLASVTIPNSVTSIGAGAFKECRSLTSVTIPNSVTSIGYSAFSSCISLTSVTIPNNVTNIGEHAFLECTGLTSITIPNSVTSIGSEAFGAISAKIIFSKLYSTYTDKIFTSLLFGASYTYNVEFNISEIPTDYNISSMLPQVTEQGKGTITYNIYTDYEPCKDQALALAATGTISNVYHIDGTPWE